MDECTLCSLRAPTLDELVYRRLLKLGENCGDRVISFKTVRQRVCPPFCLQTDQLNQILYNLSRVGLIEVVNHHGVRVKRVVE